MKPRFSLACAAAVVAIAGCNSNAGDAATNASAGGTTEAVARPADGDWSKAVVQTAEGGFRMGNPDAKVKIIEFSSMTCPHCAAFEETGMPPLVEKYVKPGNVSFEFRNYVRDAFDLTAALVARCNGPSTFFPLTTALFKDQSNWIQKVQATPPAQLEQVQTLPPNRQFLELAKIAGFQQWAAARGVPVAKSTQCLTDENAVNQLVEMNAAATSAYPDFTGTPTFIINGTQHKGSPDWKTLEPAIQAALGERG